MPFVKKFLPPQKSKNKKTNLGSEAQPRNTVRMMAGSNWNHREVSVKTGTRGAQLNPNRQVTQAPSYASWGRDEAEFSPVQACQRDRVPPQGHQTPGVHQP